MKTAPIIVIGAGAGGLAAAARLAAQGAPVLVLERAAAPGGKLQALQIGSRWLDAGPTVCTMRWVLDELFDAVGARLADHLTLRPADILARHAWGPGERLDLHADLETTVDAIGRFASAADARGYRAFCRRAAGIYQALERPFLRSPQAGPAMLAWRCGRRGLPGLAGLARIAPFATLWPALGRYFPDPRLQQLFGRYATYCGSSPFAAPATLMLVAHVEREGVWLVDGGMRRLATALAALAVRAGAQLRCDAEVAEVLVANGRASGVRLRSGEALAASAVVFNGDAAALAGGLLGDAARQGLGAHARAWQVGAARSLSALTWSSVALCSGLALSRHNVFFSDQYRAEFDALRQGRLPAQPTVYVCAQDRSADDDRDDGSDGGDPASGLSGEAGGRGMAAGAHATRLEGDAGARATRLLCLVNAPPLADARPLTLQEIEGCERQAFRQLRHCGLQLQPLTPVQRTTPADFAARYPATGGALYGLASRGWRTTFQRPGARHALPGLYLAGGSTHPGPGVPMALLSGQLAAACLLADRASTRRWHPMPMPGGTSMR